MRKLIAVALLLCATSSSAQRAPYWGRQGDSSLLSGLVSAWSLDNSVADSKGSNTLTNNNAVTFPAVGPSAVVSGLFSAGSTESLKDNGAVLPLSTFTGDFSISVWVNPSQLSACEATHGCGIVGLNASDAIGQFAVTVKTTGALQFRYHDTAGSVNYPTYANSIVPLNGWSHVVVERSSSTSVVYLNGVLQSSTGTVSSATGWGTLPFTVGTHYTTAAYHWSGNISRVGVWSRALTQGEVTSLYANGRGIPYASLSGSLLTNLLEFFNLTEASGNRAGSVAATVLTDVGTVASSTSATVPANLPARVANFLAASSKTLSVDPGPDMSAGFTLAAWVNSDITTTPVRYIATKWEDNAHAEFQLSAPSGFTRPQFLLRDGANPGAATASANFGSDPTGWYLVVIWFDNAGDQVGISANNGTPVTGAAAFAGAPNTGAKLEFGGWVFRHRVPTAAERACPYASGAGAVYPFRNVCN
jgi:hypothetical protein